jgi:hypothetical protein
MAGDHPEGDKFKRKKEKENMDTEDFNLTETADDLASAILDHHEAELTDDELEGR